MLNQVHARWVLNSYDHVLQYTREAISWACTLLRFFLLNKATYSVTINKHTFLYVDNKAIC